MYNVLSILIIDRAKMQDCEVFSLKILSSFSKIYNFLFKNCRDLRFAPKCKIYGVVFSLNKLKVKVEWFVRYVECWKKYR